MRVQDVRRTSTAIEKEAASWQARMREPESEAEVVAFEAWLAADPAHARAFADADALMSLGGRLPSRLLDPQSQRSRWSSFQPLYAAAAVALVVAGTLWVSSGGAPNARAAVSNAGPAIRWVRLRNHAIIALDTDTQLTVAPAPTSDTISLNSGRARFRVIGGSLGRPLSVETADVTIETAAGVFDVKRSGDAVDVAVVQGDVRIRSQAGRQTRLVTGQATAYRNGQFRRTERTSAEQRWPEGRVRFDDATLRSVLAIANRAGRPRVRVVGDAVGKLRVTGVLDLRDTRALARKLATALNLRFTVTPTEIVLHR